MDDDLRTIAAVPAPPEPTPDAVERSRMRLEQRTHAAQERRPLSRRGGWVRPVSAGLALAAAGTATAVVIASGPGQAPDTPGGAPKAAQVSGQRVLLVAATAAERAPAGSGTYWYTDGVRRQRPRDLDTA